MQGNTNGKLMLMAIMFGTLGYVMYDGKTNTKSITVTATAYTSHPSQTDSTPYTPACGGDLRDGQPTIAVSRDLWNAGLRCGRVVTIQNKSFVVRDKMNKRYTKRIDIYHGEDRRAALAFGKKNVTVNYRQEG